MNLKEIKVGKTYNVRVKVIDFNLARNAVVVWDCGGHPCYFRLEDFTHINPYPPLNLPTTTKIPEPAPKYDPCRKFREGDIVEPCQVKGRWGGTYWKDHSGIRLTVTQDENEEGVMWVKAPDSLSPRVVDAVYFQLVTPVEELEPYSVETCQYGYTVNKGEDILATYNDEKHPHAKAAAEAERDRLNAEYRKEQE
ncbi:MAG: hypothetical protein IJN29_05385 [Akkermansia sp.]|nr:hypothetical protein [Akkermansia sp.]